MSDLWGQIATSPNWLVLTSPLAPINLFIYTSAPAPPAGVLGTTNQIVGIQTDASDVAYTSDGGQTGATFAWLVPFVLDAQPAGDVTSFVR